MQQQKDASTNMHAQAHAHRHTPLHLLLIIVVKAIKRGRCVANYAFAGVASSIRRVRRHHMRLNEIQCARKCDCQMNMQREQQAHKGSQEGKRGGGGAGGGRGGYGGRLKGANVNMNACPAASNISSAIGIQSKLLINMCAA